LAVPANHVDFPQDWGGATMTAADKRLEELLDRWMASLELHTRYLKLDDAAYARVEAWPKHQRPTKWVVDLARQRLLELRTHVRQRQQAGDGNFAEVLELMAFLTGLLGSEHLERFIPLATGRGADPGTSGTVEQPRTRPGRAKTSSASNGARPPETKPAATSARPGSPPATRGNATKAGQVTTQATPRTATRPSERETPAPARAAPTTRAPAAATDAGSQQVIADAVRMLEWGREWPALAGLIARMADRPPEQDVWKILRAHRSEILARARRPPD
jgi:hypothetical protein